MIERKKILRMLGYFLALMLALAMLSRASASMTVARVKTSSPGNMAIYHEVSASGTVEADGEIAVSAEPGQKVSRIAVGKDQMVRAGDVLFELDRRELGDQILACRREIEALNLQISDAERAKSEAEKKRQTEIRRAEEDCRTAEAKGDQAVERAAQELDRAYRKLEEFQNSRPAIGDGESSSGETEDACLEAVYAAQKAYDDAVSDRDEGKRTALRALEDAREEEPADTSAKQRKLERRQKERALKKLERLEKADGKVTAPVDGVVTELKIAVGDLTGDGAAVLLADLSAGCRFVASIEKEKAEYVEKHAQVTLVGETQKKKLEDLEVDSVTSSDESPDLAEVTVKLPAGTLEVGSSAQMTVRQKSGTYETCIPIQALNEGSGECFVYVVEERETVLGTRLVARKNVVQVADRNESFAALTPGSLSSSQKVITSASRSVEEGSPVRLEES